MNKARQFGHRVPVHQFGQSVRLNAAPVRRHFRIPTPVVVVALGVVFAVGYLSMPVSAPVALTVNAQPVAASE